MRSKVRTTRDDHLAIGDHVFYKRKDHDEWRGPGVIIGVDGKNFIVKHGGFIVRVHEARLVGAPIVTGDGSEASERVEESRDSKRPNE